MLSNMADGDATGQDYTSTNYVYFHVMFFYTNCLCAILNPIRVLLVTWCVLIHNKVNNLTGEFWVLSLGLSSY